MHHQLVTLGEAMLRLSVRPGDRIEDAGALEVHVAGPAANGPRPAARVACAVNCRQKLWGIEAAAAASRVAAGMADVVICTLEDARDLFNVQGTGEKAASHLRSELGVETVVLTLGTEGAVAVSKEGSGKRPGHRLDTVDRAGAGA